MTTFTDEYKDLLITQYWDKPKAAAEISMKASKWEEIFNFLSYFVTAFDIDYAVGPQLDIIGKIVGMSRNIASAIQSEKFGFDTSTNAEGFADKFDSTRPSAPFLSKFEPAYSGLQLDDENYRKWLKIRIMANHAASTMVSDDKMTVQEIAQIAFDGLAEVIDNQDMTITVNVDSSFDSTITGLIESQKFLPVPAGVSIDFVVV
jgi:hypothetical protein